MIYTYKLPVLRTDGSEVQCLSVYENNSDHRFTSLVYCGRLHSLEDSMLAPEVQNAAEAFVALVDDELQGLPQKERKEK